MARTTTRHSIVVQSAKPSGVTRLDDIGSAAVVPGQLLTMNSSGEVYRHATASGASAKLFALENQTPNTNTYPTTAAIDIPYASGSTVYYCQAQAGDVINAWLRSGQSVTKGLHWLISDGAGRLKSCGTGVSVGTSNPVGIAWQTANASGGTAIRCLVRIV